MPDGGGETVIRRVLAEYPAVRFLALSVSDAPEDVLAVIRAGARGYVTKAISGPELVEAINRVADGDAVFSRRLAGFVLDAFAQIPLAHEADLLRTLLREPIEREAAGLTLVDGSEGLGAYLAGLARHSQVHCLTVSAGSVELEQEGAVVTRLIADGTRPKLTDGNGVPAEFDSDDAVDHWIAVVRRVLELWV